MDTAFTLGILATLASNVLDLLAWPAVSACSLLNAQNVEERLLTAFLATAIVWFAVALTANLILRTLLVSLRYSLLPLACSTGTLSSLRSTVHGAYRLYGAISYIASIFGAVGPRPRGDIEQVDQLRGKWPTAPGLWFVRLILRLPNAAAVAAMHLVRTASRPPGLLFLITVTWAAMRPPTTFWAPGVEVFQAILDLLAQATFIAWVPVVLLLFAVASSARVRGAYAWRTEKFKQAHAALDSLAHKAEPLLGSLHHAIDDTARFCSHTAVRKAAERLTAGHGSWRDGQMVFQSPAGRPASIDRWQRPPHSSVDRPWNWQDNHNTPSNDGDFIQTAEDLLAEYKHVCVRASLVSEVHNIAPRKVRELLSYLRPMNSDAASGARRAESLPYLGANIRVLTIDGLEGFIAHWTNSEHDHLRAQFLQLEHGAPCSPKLMTEASEAVEGLVRELRECLVEACWLEAQVRDLRDIGWRNRYPGSVKALLQSIKAR